MSLEKMIHIGQLFAFYKALLTDKQRDMLSFYYEEDLSLSEIAEHFQISRQGVHDSIRRGEKALEEYESILGLNAQRAKRLALLDQLSEEVKTEHSVQLIQALRLIDEE